MPLNKLDNFIKNTEGRILYVNPSDLDATDSIDNQGNALARPFKTIQRAIIEAARFSYVRGNNNDLIEKTTILLFPGEHIVDNRPGWAIYDNNSIAYAVPPSGGVGTPAQSALSLELNSNFDLNQEDNLLYKYNSIYGGVILPRGISLVGLDLRKTKIRPLYVPNPTDPSVNRSSIFRLTGTCYMWQLSFFDGLDNSLVYTDPTDFGSSRLSTPRFSHHKLSCFEYVDGVNDVIQYGLTDLDMYYSKISNAFNSYREILDIDKFPENNDGFSKRTPEWEIVGAFASDPIDIVSIFAGNGTTASSRVTVNTDGPHNLNVDTPIKIRGVGGLGVTSNYNISTKVQEIIDSTTFTYLLPSFPINLNPSPNNTSGSTVIIETDTVTGASPYVFNCSLRSVWGMNGMFADGSKASGFRSMVVAQFTGVSLQKDDRAFVKYDPVSRVYNGVSIVPSYGADLPAGASQTQDSRVYHLDPDAVYRNGWESSHIKISNDAFIQVVSVFAIGFTKHFDADTGGDFSITNSNSNFGQFALSSTGFRKTAFEKDNTSYITSIVPPKAIDTTNVDKINWLSVDVGLTTSIGISSRLYLFGFLNLDTPVSEIVQGYRIGAKNNEILYLNINDTIYDGNVVMDDLSSISKKEYDVTGVPIDNIFNLTTTHNLSTGEKVIIVSDAGDLPEGLSSISIYYVIIESTTSIKLASTLRNAEIGDELDVYGGKELKIISRVTDKSSGEIGSPIQFDDVNGNWYITLDPSNTIYPALTSEGGVSGIGDASNLSYVERVPDNRSIDEKLYKYRVVIPKESKNSKNPESGFIIQESSSTGFRNDSDFNKITIDSTDFNFNRNTRYISTCTFEVSSQIITVRSELPHNLNVNDVIVVKGVQSTTNTIGKDNLGYNGVFEVLEINNELEFGYSSTDIDGVTHNVGDYINDINQRSVESLGRFERRNNKADIYVYRNEIFSDYDQNNKDGVYYIYTLNASNFIENEFTNLGYSQNVVNLYPQLDRDNPNDNVAPTKTYAKRSPLGDVDTNDLTKSITRETTDKLLKSFNIGLNINSISGENTTSVQVTFDRPHGFGRIISGSITAGSSYVDGTYHNVQLLATDPDPNFGTWKGATAKVTVSSGSVTSIEIISGGSSYSGGDILYLNYLQMGLISSNSTAFLTLSEDSINRNIGDVVQFTGSTTTPDIYHRINSVDSTTSITLNRNLLDEIISLDQYAFLVGPSISISSSSGTIERTINTSSSHGLLSGNKITIIDSSNLKRGDYLVDSVVDIDTFIVKDPNITLGSIGGGYVIKHGLSSNSGVLDLSEDRFSVRNTVIYDREVFNLDVGITTTFNTLELSTLSGISTSARLPLGDYLIIDNEIVRITSKPSENTVNVIRGYFGTRSVSHVQNSLVRKIKPIPIEFRRPSNLRASGHTFEYLGYGPGNYSTSLPQVQVKTLTDRESFLSQAQSRNAGVVIYNGINNNGDTFNGNTKTVASSGEIISFDIPKPSVTGQDTSSLTVVYDEVTVKQKILVEGGTSGTILSQFDGPVTFTNDMRVKGDINIDGNFAVNSTTEQPAIFSGDVIFQGDTTVNHSFTANQTSELVGEVTVNTGIVPDIARGAYLGSSSLPFSEAWLGNISIGDGLTAEENRTIASISAELRLDAVSDIQLLKDTNVTGDLDVSGTISGSRLEVPNISPIGSIMMWPADPGSLPAEWNVCNGTAISRTTYATLFALIGTTYGAGDGSTTFNIPNMNNRFVVGTGPAYGLNATGGAANVTLTTSQIPTHSHPGSTISNSPSHTHAVTGGPHAHGTSTPLGRVTSTVNAPHSHPGTGGAANAPHSHPRSTGAVQATHAHPGSGGAANAPHSHPRSTGAVQATHSHPGSVGGANAPHAHPYQRRTTSNRGGPTNGVAIGNNNLNTSNTGGANAPHAHPLSIGQGNAPHSHPVTIGTVNAPHSHPVSVGQGNAPHSHPVTIGTVNAPHAHPVSVGANNAPHNHVVTTTGSPHTHTVASDGVHNHPFSIASEGGGASHQNLPPYRAMYYIIRIQ